VWLDSHCHVTADEFAEDRSDVLDRAEAAGVEAFVGIGSGYGIEHNARAVRLAQSDERVYASVGVHPHEASELTDALRTELEAWVTQQRVVAVGECGLDYHYMNSPREVQRRVFAEQLDLARRCRLPVVLHVRGDEPDAFEEALELWQAEGNGELEGVLHCYTGTLDFAWRALDARLLVSFSGILTFKNAHELREIARALPLDRLLVETDAPLLAPQGHRGQRNEPMHVGRVGEALAEAQGRPVAEVARITTRNARALFRLGYETSFEIRTKSASIDLVTEVDHACEALIVAGIREERPDDAILAEEGSGDERPGARWRWVIDPLDGTTNFAHGYPRFCVSIGIECEDERAVGVVYDPLLDELYAAVRGQGATRNGAPIRVSSEAQLGNAVVATGFAYDVRRSAEDNIDHFIAFVKHSRAIRRDGSAALDLCYVASGRFDAYWELKLHPWDVAAGLLIVEEAGGRTSDLSGGPPKRSGFECVASNGLLHEEVLAILRR
jgi:myo-inositol-1(or 4)-monophosphatase